MRVLIIGAGFGGLCLANALQREPGIEVQVFERHTDPTHELAGYGLHVGADGKRALKHCLDPESWDRFLAATTPAGAQWAFRDTNLRLLALRDDAKISGKPEADVERRASHRAEFRDILLRGLARRSDDGAVGVHWGKSFTRYEHLDGGRVRAHFADSTSAEGDILIGADGSKSQVREQRLPDLQREELGIVIICGRYQLDEQRARGLPALMTDGSLNNIVPYGKGWLFIASFPSTEGERRPVENYTLWAYVVPKPETPTDPKALSSSQLRDIALAGVQDWASPLVKVVRDADLSTVSPIVLRSMPRLSPWKNDNVSLLGDAIHNMTPMAGVGANIAFRDAHVLSDLLVDAHRGNTGILDAIGAYEDQMRQYANAAVALSRQIAEGASSGQKLQRWVFHCLLRLAQASPAVMKATIGRGALED
ncbi:FAD binding domain-containing protein [Cladophialophora immunda]|nr:FAD binding domain-containing protein [Cladophialophora immunda]